jgi:uroporphyrinogen-III decarboxylase
MGVDVELVENVGPVVEAPVRSMADVGGCRCPEPEESVPFILEAGAFGSRGLAPERPWMASRAARSRAGLPDRGQAHAASSKS